MILLKNDHVILTFKFFVPIQDQFLHCERGNNSRNRRKEWLS